MSESDQTRTVGDSADWTPTGSGTPLIFVRPFMNMEMLALLNQHPWVATYGLWGIAILLVLLVLYRRSAMGSRSVMPGIIWL